MIGSVTAASAGINELRRFLQASKKNSGKSTDEVFSSLGTNGDGSGTKSELSSALNGPSPRAPVPGSGSVSTSALVNLMQVLTQAITRVAEPGSTGSAGRLSAEDVFQKIDTNGDESLSKAELENGRPHDMTVAKADELYAKLDTNHDGSISKSEFTANRPGGHGGPPPPADSTGGMGGNTNSSNADSLSASSVLMQAVEKYALYGQSAAATAIRGSLAVTA
jgi:hypothetical protein